MIKTRINIIYINANEHDLILKEVCANWLTSIMTVKAAGLVIFRCYENTIQYLLLQASYGTNHWTSPKGHVDPGESEFVTALRETKEEAGLDEVDLDIFQEISHTLEYNVKGKNKTVIYWLAKMKNPNKAVTLSTEHIQFKWAELSEAKTLTNYKIYQEMLHKFHTYSVNL